MRLKKKSRTKEMINMGYIKADDVKGARIDGELYCKGCIDGDLWDLFSEEDLITKDEMGEDFYFCDSCGDRL